MSSAAQDAPAGGQPPVPLAPYPPLREQRAANPFKVTPEHQKSRNPQDKLQVVAIIGQEICIVTGRYSDYWNLVKMHVVQRSLETNHKDIARHFKDSVKVKNFDTPGNNEIVSQDLHVWFDGPDQILDVLGSGIWSMKPKDIPGTMVIIKEGILTGKSFKQMFPDKKRPFGPFDVYVFPNMYWVEVPIFGNPLRTYPLYTDVPFNNDLSGHEAPTRHAFVTGCQGFDRVSHTNPVFLMFDYAAKMRYRLILQHDEDQSVGIPPEDIKEFNEVIWPVVSHWFGEPDDPTHVRPPPKAKRAPQAPLSPTAADTAGDEEAHRSLFGGPAVAPLSVDDNPIADDLSPSDTEQGDCLRLLGRVEEQPELEDDGRPRVAGIKTAPEKGRTARPLPRRSARTAAAAGTAPVQAASEPSHPAKQPIEPTRRQPRRMRSQAGIREAVAAAAAAAAATSANTATQSDATDENNAAVMAGPSALPPQGSFAPTRVGARELRPRKQKSQVLAGPASTVNEAGPSGPRPRNGRRTAMERTNDDSDDEPLPAPKKRRIRRPPPADDSGEGYIPPPALLRGKSDKGKDKGK
ncbi:hypothetical protein BD626DRAFT_85015 [Schizophyllum amplum]|uniref:Uncharacterized protein n=1 Tax=Schizophyllum amplum TaxID=97359 RepID=A0A550C937_9AGAR|nr:hypothetical protein BD626DRAFT_85015 [Auriculariopsis ampla]